MNDPQAALLIIGAEVLSAKVVDENSPYLLKALRARGIRVTEVRTVQDSVPVISEAVRTLAHTADHLFTTGGIGPTHDDVTIAGVAHAFDVPVVRDPTIEQRLRARFGASITAAHLKMAEVPQGCRVLESTDIPIVQMRNVYVLPGVPALMRACFDNLVKALGTAPWHCRALLLDASESVIAEHLDLVQREHPDIAIGSYPRFDPGAPYRVKVTVDGRDAARVEAVAQRVKDGLQPLMLLGEE